MTERVDPVMPDSENASGRARACASILARTGRSLFRAPHRRGWIVVVEGRDEDRRIANLSDVRAYAKRMVDKRWSS